MGRRRRQNQGSLFADENDALQNPPRFGGFFDKDGYDGKPPSRRVLRAAWDVVWKHTSPFYRRSSQLLDGQSMYLTSVMIAPPAFKGRGGHN